MSKILVSAGEASGDEHAAGLLLALRKLSPEVTVRGMGGVELEKTGAEIIVNSAKSGSVMGFGAVFAKLPILIAALQRMKQEIDCWKPDLLILVDFPDFNLRLAKYAKKKGVKVLYFIPPKLWAWRTYRVSAIKKYVDKVACIFPHEEKFYRDHGYEHAHYVGHPFTSDIALKPAPAVEKRRLRQEFGLAIDVPTLAIFPGSRKSEIERHLSLVVDTFKRVKEKIPNLQAVIPVPSSLDTAEIQARVGSESGIKVVTGDSVKVLKLADVGLLKSGTSNLQAAFCELPILVFYVTSAISAFLVRRLVRLKEYSPVNVIKVGAVPEIVQELATAPILAETVHSIFTDQVRYKQIQESERAVVGAFAATSLPYEEAAKLAQNP